MGHEYVSADTIRHNRGDRPSGSTRGTQEVHLETQGEILAG